MKRASILGALAVVAGFLFAAPAAHAHQGTVGSFNLGTTNPTVTCRASANAGHTYPGRITGTMGTPPQETTNLYLCGAVTTYTSFFGYINNLPSHVKTLFDTNNVTYYYFRNYDEAKKWLEKKYGTGYTYPASAKVGILGYTDPVKKFIVVYENYYVDSSSTTTTVTSSNQRGATTYHESGHMYDALKARISESAYFKHLMQQDINRYNNPTINPFCSLYPSLCPGGTPVAPWDTWNVNTRNYEVLKVGVYKRYFNPTGTNPPGVEWHEVFAEHFGEQSGFSTELNLANALAYFKCSERYAETVWNSGTGVAPTWQQTYCVTPPHPLP